MAYDDRIPSPYGRQGLSEAIAGFWTPRRLVFPFFLIFSIWVVFAGWSAGLVDPDYYWHLKAGELIWQAGALPDGDPFSWTYQGQPWVLHEWLFQVCLHLLHEAVGPAGVALATSLLLAIAWYLAFSVADGFIHRPLVSFGLAVAFGGGIVAAAAPRPHMISILFFAILLAMFFRAKYRRRPLGLLLVPILMLPWVNMHGGFALGVAVMVALAGMEWLNLFGRPELRNRGQLWFCVVLSVAAALTVAASLANPDGIEHWKYPFYVAQLDLVSAISEWQSIAVSPARGLWYAGGAVLFFIVTLGSDRRLDVTELLFPIVVFIAGLLQARHAPFATLTFLCFAGPCVAREDAPHPAPSGLPAQALSWLLAVAALVVPAWAFTKSAYPEAARQIMPSDVVAFVREADLQGRMFNDYDVGGYLIAELYPDRKVFIDGRADLYGDEMYSAYAATMFGTRPLSAHFDGWEIDYVIARPDAPLVHLLEQRGDFRMVFEGRTHGVWLGVTGANAAALGTYPALR